MLTEASPQKKLIGLSVSASGFSERFGADKLTCTAGGVMLITRTLGAFSCPGFSRRIIVTNNPLIAQNAAALGFESIPNPLAEKGLSESVKAGARALSGMDGIMFAVGDQPFLTPQTVLKLIRAFGEHPECIIVPSADGRSGSPCIFPRRLFPELLALSGDTGGREIIKARPGQCVSISVSPAELEDVDTPSRLYAPGNRTEQIFTSFSQK